MRVSGDALAAAEPPASGVAGAWRRPGALTSSFVMRPLRPVPVTVVEVDAELARQPPDRRRCVDRRVRGGARAPAPRARRARPRPRRTAPPRRSPTQRCAANPPRTAGGVALRTVRRGGAPLSPAASRSSSVDPSDTLSPTATFSSATTPANGAGTSIVALSDSRTTSGSSSATVWPALDEDLDDRDVDEVADVRDVDLAPRPTAATGPPPRRRSRTWRSPARRPRARPSACSAATTTWWRSTSKNRRRWRR